MDGSRSSRNGGGAFPSRPVTRIQRISNREYGLLQRRDDIQLTINAVEEPGPEERLGRSEALVGQYLGVVKRVKTCGGPDGNPVESG